MSLIKSFKAVERNLSDLNYPITHTKSLIKIFYLSAHFNKLEMKYLSTLIVLILLSSSFLSFVYEQKTPPVSLATEVEVPDDVQAVLDRSCLPCHGPDGSGKAKMKWNWEKMSKYETNKLISKMVKVSEKVEEGKMPPAKNVKKNPDRKLSEDDKKMLMGWAEGVAEKAAGGGE